MSGDLTLLQFPSADVSKADFAEYDGQFGIGGIEPQKPTISMTYTPLWAVFLCLSDKSVT